MLATQRIEALRDIHGWYARNADLAGRACCTMPQFTPTQEMNHCD